MATRADQLEMMSRLHFQKLAALSVRAEGAQRMGRVAARSQMTKSAGVVGLPGSRVRPLTPEELEKIAAFGSGLVSMGKIVGQAAKGAFGTARKAGTGAVGAVRKAVGAGGQALKQQGQLFRQQAGLLRQGGHGRLGALRHAEARMGMQGLDPSRTVKPRVQPSQRPIAAEVAKQAPAAPTAAGTANIRGPRAAGAPAAAPPAGPSAARTPAPGAPSPASQSGPGVKTQAERLAAARGVSPATAYEGMLAARYPHLAPRGAGTAGTAATGAATPAARSAAGATGAATPGAKGAVRPATVTPDTSAMALDKTLAPAAAGPQPGMGQTAAATPAVGGVRGPATPNVGQAPTLAADMPAGMNYVPPSPHRVQLARAEAGNLRAAGPPMTRNVAPTGSQGQVAPAAGPARAAPLSEPPRADIPAAGTQGRVAPVRGPAPVTPEQAAAAARPRPARVTPEQAAAPAPAPTQGTVVSETPIRGSQGRVAPAQEAPAAKPSFDERIAASQRRQEMRDAMAAEDLQRWGMKPDTAEQLAAGKSLAELGLKAAKTTGRAAGGTGGGGATGVGAAGRVNQALFGQTSAPMSLKAPLYGTAAALPLAAIGLPVGAGMAASAALQPNQGPHVYGRGMPLPGGGF